MRSAKRSLPSMPVLLLRLRYRKERELLRNGRTILQGLVAFAIDVFFCFLFLGKVALAVVHYFSHVTNIILIVARWNFLGILLQDQRSYGR